MTTQSQTMPPRLTTADTAAIRAALNGKAATYIMCGYDTVADRYYVRLLCARQVSLASGPSFEVRHEMDADGHIEQWHETPPCWEYADPSPPIATEPLSAYPLLREVRAGDTLRVAFRLGRSYDACTISLVRRGKVLAAVRHAGVCLCHPEGSA